MPLNKQPPVFGTHGLAYRTDSVRLTDVLMLVRYSNTLCAVDLRNVADMKYQTKYPTLDATLVRSTQLVSDTDMNARLWSGW